MGPVGADAVVPPSAGRAARLRAWRAARRPRVRLAPGVLLGRGVVLDAAPGCRILVRDGAALGDGARIEAVRGDVVIGAGAVLGDRASIRGDGPVRVGEECVIGAWARVEGPAVLGARCRLGAHAAALGGADVGPGAVLGSYAVVDGTIAARAVVEGRTP